MNVYLLDRIHGSLMYAVGSGYTVEGQKTGEEKHGGLQIEIIPAYPQKAQKWLAATEEEALQDPGLYLDESKTPAQLGLEAGTQVRVYPSPPTYGKSVEVGDLYRVKEDSCLGVVNLEVRCHVQPRHRRNLNKRPTGVLL